MGSLSSLILIYVGIQRLLAYSNSDFQGNAEKYLTMLPTSLVTYLTTPLTISSKTRT